MAEKNDVKGAYRSAMIAGGAALYSGRFELALTHYFHAMDLQPDHMSPALGALRCLNLRGNGEARGNVKRRVQDKVDRLSANPKTEGAGFLLAARLAIALRKPGEALDKARLAVDRLATLGVAWRVMGEAAMLAEQWAQAVDALRMASSLGLSAAAGTWERLADALDEHGRPQEGVVAARQALVLTGHDLHARRRRLNLLATLLKHAGHLEDARVTIQEAVNLDPRDPAVLHNQATITEASGKVEAAITLYKAALSSANVPMTRWRLGHALLKLERYGEAFEAFKACAASMDRWTWPASTRWLPLFELGKLHHRAELNSLSVHWFELSLRETRSFEASKQVRSWLAFVSGQIAEKAP